MNYYLLKIIVTSVLIVLISELAKRSSFMGAILASIPVISVLSIIWLYIDTKNVEKVTALSHSVFWLVLPSLTLFIVLPSLLGRGIHFIPSLGIAIFATICCYFAIIYLLGYFGIRL